MIFIFNVLGIGMILGGALLGVVVWGGVSLVTGDNRLAIGLGGLWGMGVIAGSDLWHRATHHRQLGVLRFFAPTTGGMLYYVPLWVLVGAMPMIGLVHATTRKPARLIPATPRAAPTEADNRARGKGPVVP